jgi:hypothetical protein
MTVVLSRAELPHVSGLPRDTFVNDFVFESSNLSNTLAISGPAVQDFYNVAHHGGNILAHFISLMVTRLVPVTVKHYDITAHLDGSPHGAPVATTSFTLGSNTSTGDALPEEVACVLSFHAPYGTDQEESGVIRPRARDRGRIYIGPFDTAALNSTVNTTPSSILMTSILDGGRSLLDLVGANWRQWSRAAARVQTVSDVWVDNAWDTQRRRGPRATARQMFP